MNSKKKEKKKYTILNHDKLDWTCLNTKVHHVKKMDSSSINNELEDQLGENSMDEELLQIFYLEFEQLMDSYKEALKELRKINGDRKKSFYEIFRVFHTLKGDSAYFPPFEEFTKFTTIICEQVRDLPESRFHDELLIKNLRLNYARLSSVLLAMNNGQNLRAFRFKMFLLNF